MVNSDNILRNHVDPVVFVGSRCRILWANRAFVEFLCLPPEEIVGKTCYRLLHNTEGPFERCPCLAVNESRRCNRELTVFHAIGDAIVKSPDLQETLTNVLSAMLKAFHADGGGIHLIKSDTDSMTLRVHKGYSDCFVEEAIRTLAERILTELGYTVLLARTGEEVVDQFLQHRDEISLAILDVVMPRMGGKAAFKAMQKENPGLRVIFMSGYAADAVHESFVVKPGTPFPGKPFAPVALARKVREVLDRQG